MLNSSNNLIGISGHDRSMLSTECHSDCLFYGLHEQFSFWSFVIEFAFWSSSMVRSKPSAATCQLDNNSFIHRLLRQLAATYKYTNNGSDSVYGVAYQLYAVTHSTWNRTTYGVRYAELTGCVHASRRTARKHFLLRQSVFDSVHSLHHCNDACRKVSQRICVQTIKKCEAVVPTCGLPSIRLSDG